MRNNMMILLPPPRFGCYAKALQTEPSHTRSVNNRRNFCVCECVNLSLCLVLGLREKDQHFPCFKVLASVFYNRALTPKFSTPEG